MRIRPNEENLTSLVLETRENDLYRALQSTFEHLIQPEDPDKYNLKNDCYVSHPGVEASIAAFCTGTTSAAAFLIGPTGIGKSTLLRHSLGLNRSPLIVGDTLYIMYSLNQRAIPNEDAIRMQIAALLQEAAWLLKEGQSSHLSDTDYVDLTQFILDSSADLLNSPKLDLSKSPLERTRAFSAEPSCSYQFSQIAVKFFASKNLIVSKIVFILDDLEMKTTDLQEHAVRNAIETMYCLKNFGGHRSVTVRLLVALRPETHGWISRLEQVNTTKFKDISYRQPVSVYEIFRKRFDAVFTRDDYAHIRDRSRLDSALDVLNAVGAALSTKYSERVVRLHNFNLRDAIESFSTVISNRRWMQRDREYEPFFTVDEHNFALSQASVLRALGMGEGEVYPKEDPCLVNLLWNTREASSDLVLLYIVKYLLTRSNRPEKLESLVENLSSHLAKDFPKRILVEITEYAITKQLLHAEKSSQGTVVTLTPRAQELHLMLGESTILLGLFRDDICLPTHEGRALKPTASLAGAAGAFMAVADLIIHFWEIERRLRVAVADAGASESGASYFGLVFEAAKMREAFSTSIAAFYRTDERDKWPTAIKNKLQVLSQLQIPPHLRA